MKMRNLAAVLTAAGIALLLLSPLPGIFRPGPESIVIRNESKNQKSVLAVPVSRMVEVGFIHSLYGGRQTEQFLVGPDRVLNLQQVKFEVYDALLYYTGGSHARESRADGFWLIPSDFRTDSIRYILPQRQRDFYVRIGEKVYPAEKLGEPGDAIRIHVGGEP